MEAWNFHAEVDEQVVWLEGELDIATAPTLAACFEEVRSSPVVVDLSRLVFMDARGLDAIVAAANRLSNGGHLFEVRGAHGIVRRVFEIAGRRDLLSD